jgi:hypothetical protein
MWFISILGYKQRDKIAKALHSRGDAIRTALESYKTAAAAMNPPRPALTWKDIVNMATLGDFDLLRDTNRSILKQSWTDPEVREVMTLHFRLKRAREEVHRLNVEIRRQCTYMQDEFLLYTSTIKRLWTERSTDTTEDVQNENLASHLQKELTYQSTIFSHVTYHLMKTSKLSCFSGTLVPRVWTAGNDIVPMQSLSPPSLPKWMRQLEGRAPIEEDVVHNLMSETADEEALEDSLMLEWAEKLNIVPQLI